MRPSDLYALEPIERTHDLYRLINGGFSHVPEIDSYMFGEGDKKNTRVELRFYRDVCYDGRRTWTLGSVWFDDQPVMVFQNAGREGDDHVARYVTHPVRYREMTQYLLSLVPIADVRDCVDPDEDIEALTSFYGDNLAGDGTR